MFVLSSLRSVALAAAVLSVGLLPVAGCKQKPPAAAPPPPPPPAKPKPKCEALIEGCKASSSTKARVANSNLVFVPPEGWVYAQETEITLARPKDGSALLGLAAFDTPDDKARDAAFHQLAGSLEIELPLAGLKKTKFLPAWAKADDAKAGEVEVKIYLTDPKKQPIQVKHGEDKGFLLIAAASIGDGKTLLGIAFSPETDETSGELILKSLETFTKGKGGSSSAGKSKDKDAGGGTAKEDGGNGSKPSKENAK